MAVTAIIVAMDDPEERNRLAIELSQDWEPELSHEYDGHAIVINLRNNREPVARECLSAIEEALRTIHAGQQAAGRLE